MIIGLSGNAGSTVGAVIRLLFALSKNPNAYYGESPLPREAYAMVIENLKKHNHRDETSGWEVKQFTDIPKQIACLILGCTREELEDARFKERLLGNEWDKYRVTRHNIYMAATHEYFATREESLKKVEEYGLFGSANLLRTTPDLLYQLIEEKCGRKEIHPNIWINALFNGYSIKKQYQRTCLSCQKGFDFKDMAAQDDRCPHCGSLYHAAVFYEPTEPNWIIIDVKFQNEAEAIKSRSGILIKVDWDGDLSEDMHLQKSSASFDARISAKDLEGLIDITTKILIDLKLL